MRVYEGSIVTCNEQMAVANYLVEDKGRIVYVGNELGDEYKEATRISLNGKAMLPSFCDTHIHFSSYALFSSTLDIRGVKNFKALEAVFVDYIEKNNPKLILAFGMSQHFVEEKRLITKDELDAMDVKIPIMIIKYDGHASIVNSKMMDQLPENIKNLRGYYPVTGQMYQEAYFKATDYVTSQVSIIDLLKNMIKGIDRLSDYGIGLIHTVEGIGFPLDMDISISRLLSKGLKNPFSMRLFFQTMKTKKVLKRKLPRIGGCFETALDGCYGSVDAALSEPYLISVLDSGQEIENPKGILFYTDEEVERFVMEAHSAGLQISMHAIGDAAFNQAVNAYEKALTALPRKNHRHTIIHGCLASEEALKKAGELGILISVQPAFIQWELEPYDYMEQLIGERAMQLNPLKSMIRNNIRISGGSDAPCTIPNPIEGIYAACNHYNNEESLSIEEALKMYTINGAYAAFDEQERGSLEVGKWADMIIVNKNPLTMEVNELNTLQVESLMLKGKPYTKGQKIGSLIRRGILGV